MTTKAINKHVFMKQHWSNQDKQNAEVVLDFVQLLMNNHDLDLIEKKYASSQYIQHNRNIGDGITGLVQYFRSLSKQFPEFSYDVKNIMVDGDLVTLHSHATVKKAHRGNDRKGFNIVDTWRIEEGELVEHWDSIQPLDNVMRFYYWITGGKIRNQNGVFKVN